ncbi:globin-coupled sensor protein [Halorientalis pallida]|uniref:Globin-coupled sensor protein n=1 Tax=Halorientalis pallida TaxID=2479928 RepID=A0A498KYQ5_9EURY|nr:globin-coupled sensor protein [Halorientalis pallida]RXK47008.1 globin-coupled sensor protein [Halorientalis pallida]
MERRLDQRGSVASGQSLGTDYTTDEIASALDLDRTEINWRKEFVNFGPDDAERLERLQPIIDENREELVDAFLKPVFATPETKEITDRSPRNADALNSIVSGYYDTVVNGDYGPDYFRHRTRIGMLHDKLDMPLHYFAGMFSNITTTLIDALCEDIAGTYQSEFDEETSVQAVSELQTAKESLKSLVRILNLDMQVVNDTYLYSFTESLRDEIEASQEMRETVSESIETAQESSVTVSENTAELRELIEDFNERSASVATEVSDLSATVEEIAASSQSANETSREASEKVQTGKERAAESVAAMEDIEEAQADLQERIDGLVAVVDEMDEIVEVINDIADQTNILALNASIEAARAGEAGSGFAVVADEVKSLAEQTQNEAGEVESLLESVTDEIEEASDQLETVAGSVTAGQSKIEETDEVLDDIKTRVDDASASMDEVATATDNQAASTEEVSSMLDTLDDRAREMVAEVESLETETEAQATQMEAIAEATDSLERGSRLELTDVTSKGDWNGEMYPTQPNADRAASSRDGMTDGGSLQREWEAAPIESGGSELPSGVSADLYGKLPDAMPDEMIAQLDRETLERIADGETGGFR